MLAVVVVQHAQRQPRRVAGQLVHSADGVVDGGGDGDVAGGEDVGERVVVRQGAVAAAVEAFDRGLAAGGVFEVLPDGAGAVAGFACHEHPSGRAAWVGRGGQ